MFNWQLESWSSMLWFFCLPKYWTSFVEDTDLVPGRNLFSLLLMFGLKPALYQFSVALPLLKSFWLTFQRYSCPFEEKKNHIMTAEWREQKEEAQSALQMYLLTQLHCQCLLASHPPYCFLIHRLIKFSKRIQRYDIPTPFLKINGLGEKRDSFSSQMRKRRNNAVHMFFCEMVAGREYWSARYTIGHGTNYQYILCLILVKQEIWGSHEYLGHDSLWEVRK